MGRIVGIDFGKKRIGVALSDESKFLASPLLTLEKFSSLKEASLNLKKAVSAYSSIEAVVVGLPLHMSGEESNLSRLARQFAEVLKETLGVPIIFWDERLSSLQVERSMKEAGVNRKKQAKLTDKLAAAAILQNYLDSQVGI